jgi:Zn-dependent M28 family amino/carboxypeptidase
MILESVDGPEVPREWRGAGPFTYRAGSGKTIVRMRVTSDDRIRPVWTVTGLIRGSTRPEEIVIVGNHRDAWVYGGVDPSSGSAALIELARVLGAMTRNGWRPERSILFASWDAEEFALTPSTEWGEQHEAWLRRSAVAYLNVDSAASGPGLSVTAPGDVLGTATSSTRQDSHMRQKSCRECRRPSRPEIAAEPAPRHVVLPMRFGAPLQRSSASTNRHPRATGALGLSSRVNTRRTS